MSPLMFALIDVHSAFHTCDFGTGGMLSRCACLGGLAVLAHRLKQAHNERQ